MFFPVKTEHKGIRREQRRMTTKSSNHLKYSDQGLLISIAIYKGVRVQLKLQLGTLHELLTVVISQMHH